MLAKKLTFDSSKLKEVSTCIYVFLDYLASFAIKSWPLNLQLVNDTLIGFSHPLSVACLTQTEWIRAYQHGLSYLRRHLPPIEEVQLDMPCLRLTINNSSLIHSCIRSFIHSLRLQLYVALSGATDITYTPSPTPAVDTYHAEVSSIVEVERCRIAAGRPIVAVCWMVTHGVQHTRISIGMWAM